MSLTKHKFSLILLVLAIGIVVVLLVVIRQKDTPAAEEKKSDILHYANNVNMPITLIEIRGVYFVPADRTSSTLAVWKPTFDLALKQTAEFYEKQLANKVKVSYKMYPAVVVGQQATNFYDGEKTTAGNPQALLNIRTELAGRLFLPGGDLYEASFSRTEGRAFSVLAVFYEGVGSSGTMAQEGEHLDFTDLGEESQPALLLARDFLTAENYQDYGNTFLAHEFGHVLGFQDHYNLITGQPFTEDIMGSGRYRPLPYTFISNQDKQLVGMPQ